MTDGDYSGRIMEIYDLLYPVRQDEVSELAVALRALAPGTRVMEYGIGSGRIALPLREEGFEMSGIDISKPMLDLLAQRDSDAKIRASEASFTTPGRTSEHDVVLSMINTAFFAHTPEDQRAMFDNAAGELVPGGIFALETFNPLLFSHSPRPSVEMRALDPTTVLMEQFTLEPVYQFLIAQCTAIGRGDPIIWTQILRYMYPSEMDAIARNAGFQLIRRSADWQGAAPYGAASPRCVTIYRR